MPSVLAPELRCISPRFWNTWLLRCAGVGWECSEGQQEDEDCASAHSVGCKESSRKTSLKCSKRRALRKTTLKCKRTLTKTTMQALFSYGGGPVRDKYYSQAQYDEVLDDWSQFIYSHLI
ncbi:hypothetical protein OROMI_020105 [Orobanche minor]